MDFLRSKALRERRANLVEQNKAVLAQMDGATDARIKELTSEWDKRDGEIDALKVQIDRVEKQEKTEAELAEPIRRTTAGRHVPAPSKEAEAELEARYKRAYWDNLRGFSLEAEDLALLASRRRSVRGEVIDLDKRALATTPGAAGGFTIPKGFISDLEVAMANMGGVRPVAKILRTSKGNQLPWPTMNDVANKAVIVAEGGPTVPVDMTFGEVVFGAYMFRTAVVVSLELLQDEDVGLEGVIKEAIGERFFRGTNQYHTTGTGVSQPQGCVTASAKGADAATATGVAYADLVALEHSVDAAYRKGAVFMMDDLTVKAIKLLVDSQQRPLWVPGIAVSEPDTILGYRYQVNNEMAEPAAGAKSILFGNFQKFVIRDVQDLLIVRANELHLANGQVGFYAFFRNDSRLLDAGVMPIRHLLHP